MHLIMVISSSKRMEGETDEKTIHYIRDEIRANGFKKKKHILNHYSTE